MPLSESGETYLETILLLSNEYAYVRAVDIGERLGYTKPSVSRALGLLRDGGYITVDDFSAVRLTDAGRAEAQRLVEYRETLIRALMALGVAEQTAAADAARLRHALSEETFAAIKKHLEMQNKQ